MLSQLSNKVHHMTRMQKRVIFLKLIVALMLAYSHYYPGNIHFGFVTNMLWLIAF